MDLAGPRGRSPQRALLLATASLLAFAVAASALAGIEQPATVTPTSMDPFPATLAAGSGGTTVIGAGAPTHQPASFATTTGASLPILSGCCVEALQVLGGDHELQVQVKAISGTGSLATDTVTVQLLRGAVPTTQVILVGTDILSGSGDQLIGSQVTLDDEDIGGSLDLSIRAFGVCVGTCSFSLHILFTIPGQPEPAFVYPYSLTVT